MKLSKLSQNYLGQGMFQILSKAKQLQRNGKHLIHFQLGDPDFNTPNNIKQRAIQSLNNDQTHYTQSSGLFDFKKTVQDQILKTRFFKPQINQILSTVGANMQIYLALARTCDPGDEVIIPNPYFPTYMARIKALGLKPVQIQLLQEDNFQINIKNLQYLISDKTKVILINSPGNPTGSILNKQIIKEIFNICKNNDLLLISDQVYSKQVYNQQFYSPSVLDECKQTVLIVQGFSKSFAMTGWRLGYSIGPEKLIIKMKTLLQTIVSCVPPFIQRAGISALKNQNQIINMNKQYYNRMILMSRQINKIQGLRCNKPNGALYCWIDIKQTKMTSKQFSDLLLNKGVVVCPGQIFGKEGYIRMCYCTSKQNIIQGLRRIKEWNK